MAITCILVWYLYVISTVLSNCPSDRDRKLGENTRRDSRDQMNLLIVSFDVREGNKLHYLSDFTFPP